SEDLAELVIGHLADKADLTAQGRDASGGVSSRTAGAGNARAHYAVKALSVQGIDKGHGALGQLLLLEECIGGLRQHVHNGVADGGDVVLPVVHSSALPKLRAQQSAANAMIDPRRLRKIARSGLLGLQLLRRHYPETDLEIDLVPGDFLV